MARPERTEIYDSAKESIKEFLEFVSAKEVTSDRIYFYAVRLRLLAEFMGEDFLRPDVKNITKLITKLKSSESRRD